MEGTRVGSNICDTTEGRFTIDLTASRALGYADAADAQRNQFVWRLDPVAQKLLVARAADPHHWASTGTTSRVAKARIAALAAEWKEMAASEGTVM